LQAASGGYGYDRRIIAELRALGWVVDIILLGDAFPWPDKATLAEAELRLEAIDASTLIVIDGLAFGVMPEIVSGLSRTRQLIALVHHPLALENGLSDSAQFTLRASETQALVSAKHVIVTSQATASLMPEFGVQPDRVSVVYPGTQTASRARGGGTQRVELLSVGSLIPRKGFDVLVSALAKLTDLDWHLTIIGDNQRDAVCAAALTQQISACQLGDRITQTGTLTADELASYYDRSDVFVLASRFEGYGMAYAEAMARGLPVIGTTGGAISDTVPEQAGVLVPPGDVNALAQAIALMVREPLAREKFAQGAWQSAQLLPTWKTSGIQFADILANIDR
jgi:glycosyltransferase involved in cell wall biosynthesis